MTTLPPSCADCLEIWEPQPTGTLTACPGTVMGLLYRPVHRADNLTTFMCRLSWNLGASTYWNPQGLSRAVMVLLYRPVRRADNLTTFMCWLSWNLGVSTSWNPQGLSRTCNGIVLHFYLYWWPVSKPEHSPSPSSEVNNEWRLSFTSHTPSLGAQG
jgi:hypothetical protein